MIMHIFSLQVQKYCLLSSDFSIPGGELGKKAITILWSSVKSFLLLICLYFDYFCSDLIDLLSQEVSTQLIIC